MQRFSSLFFWRRQTVVTNSVSSDCFAEDYRLLNSEIPKVASNQMRVAGRASRGVEFRSGGN